MSVAVVTGSSGLVGSETVRFLHGQGLDVHGIDNDARAVFLGPDASTAGTAEALRSELRRFTHHAQDVRDEHAVDRLLARLGPAVTIVVHAAGQPSHEWSASAPLVDFGVNATATLVLLEAVRRHCPRATFLFTSSNRVYGDAPNRLPLVEGPRRWELAPGHPFAEHGIDESMSVDGCTHGLMGAGKLAADVLVQEYARSFGLRTGVFRCGCLTGPAHRGAPLHGFLAWLVRCAVSGRRYEVLGHGGRQVRDNLHAGDLAAAFWEFHRAPRPGAVYNLGGSRSRSCSILEAIDLAEELGGRPVARVFRDAPRPADHRWWISDVRRFQRHYPAWRPRRSLRDTLQEMLATERTRTLRGRTKLSD